MRLDTRFRRVVVLVAFALSACGGGGGGGGGFSLDKHSLSFTGNVGEGDLPAQAVRMTISGSSVAYVGTRWKDEVDPGWAAVDMTQPGENTFDIRVWVRTAGLTTGTYHATLEAGTADSSGNVLGVQQIALTVTMKDSLRFDGQAPRVAAVFGYPTTSQLPIAVKGAAGKRWQVTSDAPWLTVPAAVQAAGTTTFQATVNTTGVVVGSQVATIRLSSPDAGSETATFPVTLDVAAPELSVSVDSVALGGTDGLSFAAQPVSLSLDTGSNAYPWTATVTTDDGAAWLVSDALSGTVSATPSQLNLRVDRSKVRSGRYTGQLHLSVNVQGTVLQRSVPVTLNAAAEGLYLATNGVALSKFPNMGVLTRTIRVTTTADRAGAPWTASSNSAWLSATPSGTTGGDLVLAADPTGLTADHEYIAQVTLTSSDPSIESDETVRVGLWVGSTDPIKVTKPYAATNSYYLYTVNDPVEPYEFVSSSGTDVAVYNVYTGALVKTFAGVAPELGEMTVSSDGTTLFVVDATNYRIRPIRVADGTLLPAFQLTSDYMNYAMGIQYARPNGHPLLLTTMTGVIFDVATRTAQTATLHTMAPGDTGGVQITVTPDGRHVALWGRSGYSSWDQVQQDELTFSPLTGQVTVTAGKTIMSSLYLVDVALTPDADRLYTAEYDVKAFDPVSGSQVQTITLPTKGAYTSVAMSVALLPDV
jgi:hypothetical protein